MTRVLAIAAIIAVAGLALSIELTRRWIDREQREHQKWFTAGSWNGGR